MLKAHRMGLSAKARTQRLHTGAPRHATMHHLMSKGRTSPSSAPMTFAGPSKQVHETHPRPANA